MILQPTEPTIRRFFKLSTSRYTMLRFLQYEVLQNLHLQGRVLDLGGGERVGYLDLFQLEGELDSINIDPSLEPTIVGDLRQPLPLPGNSREHIFAFNLLEHLPDAVPLLKESLRVLSPGGTLHITIPFLYHVHASPSDYCRYTSFWWEETLSSLGYCDVRIQPLVWDSLSSAYQLYENITCMRYRLLRPLFLLRGLLAKWAAFGSQERIAAQMNYHACRALGYYVVAAKPGTPNGELRQR